jgi:hypothetical protein
MHCLDGLTFDLLEVTCALCSVRLDFSSFENLDFRVGP